LVGGLLGLRSDIGCAVPGSGNMIQLAKQKHPDAPTAWIDPAAMAPKIVKSNARVLVVTDPNDEIVPVERQSPFVSRLREAGGSVEQLFVQATDDKHHGVTLYAVYAMDACMRGQSDTQIAAGLAAYVKSRVASAKPTVRADVRAATRADTRAVAVRKVKIDVTAAPSREPAPTGVAAVGRDSPRTEVSARKPSDVMPPRG
jgi:hypothetical protein